MPRKKAVPVEGKKAAEVIFFYTGVHVFAKLYKETLGTGEGGASTAIGRVTALYNLVKTTSTGDERLQALEALGVKVK